VGRASRAKKERGPRKSREELLETLDESQQFLERSAQAFDDGFEAEAKRIAVTLRVLLHDTGQSHSLLHQLKVKDRMMFLDTADPIHPRNLAPTPGLVMMKMTARADGSDGRYVAKLDMSRTSSLKGFASWWTDPVMKVDGTWSRKELVLTLANQEGGAHVDPALNDRYVSLARNNGIGFMTVTEEGEAPFEGSAVAAAVRQIAYEVSLTLRREAWRLA
jgi:hypothetical protein